MDQVYCVYKQREDYHKRNHIDTCFMQTFVYFHLNKRKGKYFFQYKF